MLCLFYKRFGTRNCEERKNIYMIFSKEGFSFSPEDNVLLIDLARMLRIIDETIRIRVID
ncbi:MAG: hypothetical protein ACTSUJ_00020 [Candidatus Njordarchaeales archaeon]